MYGCCMVSASVEQSEEYILSFFVHIVMHAVASASVISDSHESEGSHLDMCLMQYH